MPKFFKL
ncbi:hypothetical protein [Plasmodium yoelii yoelii]|nr:hypothetical protein [Plasmodium yoelii yoelii]